MREILGSTALSWVARIWSFASIAFVLVFIFGEVFRGHGAKPTAAEWIGLALFPGGVVVGLVVAWFRDGIGWTIATGCLIGFYGWNLLERGRFPTGPYFLLVAAPGILFLLSSLIAEASRGPASVITRQLITSSSLSTTIIYIFKNLQRYQIWQVARIENCKRAYHPPCGS